MGYPLKTYYSKIYKRYDLVNRIFTFNMDERWRKITARECLINRPQHVLDLCCGTGDLTVKLAKLANGDTEVIGYDFSEPMLDVAHRKIEKQHFHVDLVAGDVAKMPFADGFFDSIGITFGFRNLIYENENRNKHLQEIQRVLKKGGLLVIAESSKPESAFIRFFYNFYLNFIVSKIGGLISGNFEAYKYLVSSSANYLTPDEVTELLYQSGFSKVSYQLYMAGATAIFVVQK